MNQLYILYTYLADYSCYCDLKNGQKKYLYVEGTMT